MTQGAAFAYIARSRAASSSGSRVRIHILAGQALLKGRGFAQAKVTTMSRRCELTGIGPMVGHNVSHSNIKTKRRFLPALSPATLQSESLGQSFKLRISNAALRTLDFKGGLDTFLLGAKDEQLSPRALKIKAQVKAKAKAAAQAA
ncbi:ribosomal protein L28 [Caulobacter segnis ATCC 21756]|nr:ribosomal protein L28 [Caulobacter segnis ATCC 21756]